MGVTAGGPGPVALPGLGLVGVIAALPVLLSTGHDRFGGVETAGRPLEELTAQAEPDPVAPETVASARAP